jgi:PhnB protein
MIVPNVLEAMDFYEKVFNAKRGDVYHHFFEKIGDTIGNIIIGDVHICLMDKNSNYGFYPPCERKIYSMCLQIVVDDCKSTLQKAKNNGAIVEQKPVEFMGIKQAQITDPFGYTWNISQIIHKISFEESCQKFK